MQLLLSFTLFVAIYAYSCNGQQQVGTSPWSISGGKLYIVTDPETGASVYIPASLFYQRLRSGRNPVVCDLLTNNCWRPGSRAGTTAAPAVDQEEEEEETGIEETTDDKSKGSDSKGQTSTIFGHPNFHQGDFSDSTTRRPFRPWTSGNSFSSSSASAASASGSGSSGAGSKVTSTTTGRVGSGTIFGHPTFHQGDFSEEAVTTRRPFRPSDGNVIPSGSSTSSSSSSTNNGNGRTAVIQTSSTRGARTKRAAYGSSSSSSSYTPGKGGYEQSHHSSSSHDSGFHGPDYDHYNYMQQQFQNFPQFGGAGAGAFSGANANAGHGFGFGGNFGQFPAAYPGPNYNYAGAGVAAAAAASSSGSYAGDASGRNQYGGSSSGYGHTAESGSGSGYSGSSHHHEGDYGDHDMHYSTVTGKDGMVHTKMEGKKCDANGCRSTSSSSMVHDPNANAGYSKSGYGGQHSGSSSDSSSSSSGSGTHYASSKGGNDASHYDLPATTTKKPSTYTYSTTAKPYTYSTTKYPYTYTSTTTQYTTTSTKPYVYIPPKARQ